MLILKQESSDFKEPKEIDTFEEILIEDENNNDAQIAEKRKFLEVEEVSIENDVKKQKQNEKDKDESCEIKTIVKDNETFSDEEFTNFKQLLFREFEKSFVNHLPLNLIVDSLKFKVKEDLIHKFLKIMQHENKLLVADKIVYLI